jgi:hypothetical protein
MSRVIALVEGGFLGWAGDTETAEFAWRNTNGKHMSDDKKDLIKTVKLYGGEVYLGADVERDPNAETTAGPMFTVDAFIRERSQNKKV